MEALEGKLWSEDSREALDRYDFVRKVEPMQRALESLDAQAWLTGLRSRQTTHRGQLKRIHASGGYRKILPILHWISRDVHDYLNHHQLPVHPLSDKGYVSVGDWHSSRPLQAGDTHDRDTRFRGIKQECGLHLDIAEEASQSFDSSGL
ncbi:MAG: phosphoadenylyl-sulfate reductase, partial [Acidobacteriota bacterium]